LNLGTEANAWYIKINARLTKEKTKELHMLLKEFKYVFTWTYKDLKGRLPKLVQHRIKFDISTNTSRYKLNLNYVAVVKQYIDKLLVA
jgi:hypothetical protein